MSIGVDLSQRFLIDLLSAKSSDGVNCVAAPTVDIAEKDEAYEVTAALAGLDEKNTTFKAAQEDIE